MPTDDDEMEMDRSIDEKLYKRECTTVMVTVQRQGFLPPSNTRILIISLLVYVLNLP